MWTGRKCQECKGCGQDGDGHACKTCAGTGDEYDNRRRIDPRDIPDDWEAPKSVPVN